MEKVELKKVLVIDDDEATNLLTKLYFKESDLNIELNFVTSAEDAIEYINKTDSLPCIILLDINLPVMSGWDFLNYYYPQKNYNLNTKVFILSTSVFEKDKDLAKTFPYVLEFIEKPLSVKKIIELKRTYFL